MYTTITIYTSSYESFYEYCKKYRCDNDYFLNGYGENFQAYVSKTKSQRVFIYVDEKEVKTYE